MSASVSDFLDRIPVDQVPAAIVRLAGRVLAAPATPTPAPQADELLTVDEAARLLKVPRGYVYQHSKDLGAIHVGRKVRFSRKRILARLAR